MAGGGRKETSGEMLNEGNWVILQRTDLAYQSFHKCSFGKGSRHNVNPISEYLLYWEIRPEE